MTPDGFDRRPDGTLVRRELRPFTGAWYRDNPPPPPPRTEPEFHICGYATAYHLDGRCPSEAEARERSGR